VSVGAQLGVQSAPKGAFTLCNMEAARASAYSPHPTASARISICARREIAQHLPHRAAPDRTQPHAFGGTVGGTIPRLWGHNMLSDVQIRKAAAKGKPYKMADERGLYLYITAAGGKSWRLKYRYGGKEQLLTFGLWPDVSLARARDLAREARAHLAEGVNPGLERRKARAMAAVDNATTFEAVAREWHAKQAGRWAKRQHKSALASLEREIFPSLGAFPIAEITVPLVLSELVRIERRGAVETAHRLRRRVEAVFAYAIATGRATRNPARDLKGALAPVQRTTKQPAILDEAGCRTLYQAISNGPGELEAICCAMFQALTAVRPSDAREARWSEIEGLDGPAPVWTVPAARLKGTVAQKGDKGRRHVVPLSGAAVAVLERVRQISGHQGLVFPSARFPGRPMSDMTLSMMYRRAGYEGRHVPHGWRASFSTIMNERHPAERDAIDAALAHVKGGTEGRYNRAEHLARRRDLFAEWAAILEDNR